MAVVSFQIELCISRAMSALYEAMREWPLEKIDRFESDWNDLRQAGAELCEVRVFGSRVIGYPSEDFTLFLTDWGVYLQ